MRWLILLLAIATGCGSHCADIAARKQALLARTASAPGPHVEIQLPLARANAFIAGLLQEQPLAVPLEVPKLGPIAIAIPALTATAVEVRILPAAPDRVRFAIRIAIADDHPITTINVETEVTPRLVREADGTELSAGFGPANLTAARPELGGDAKAAIVQALRRWVPDAVPTIVLEAAADRFASHLIGEAYSALQRTLLRRLGDVTQLKIRLPELPIAKVALASTNTRLTIDLTTDLPVRRALAPIAASDQLSVRMSSSTATAVANWSIDHGRLPQHYTRGLEPKPDGEFRPYFDYVAEDARRPVKIHLFQERGGCSYFEVGFLLAVALDGDQLVVSALDRYVESADAGKVIDSLLWLKQLILGAVDSSKRAVAQTRLTIGSRSFTTRIVGASAAHDELAFQLRLDAP